MISVGIDGKKDLKKDRMARFYKYNVNHLGFTLIELLIAMAITTIVAAGIFSTYQNQQKAYLAQKQVVEMQQTLRMAIYIMTSEIRMAGYDTEGTNGAEIVSAGDGSSGSPLQFTFVADDDSIDNDGDSTVDEAGELKTIAYDLYDGYSDGDSDIGRAVGAGNRQPIAENIARLEFAYSDEDGIVMPLPIAALDLPKIRSVQIAIEATIDSNATNYFQGNNRILTTTIKCRNLGLEL
jgi:type IV pilus assembly protein PilW